MLRAEKRYYIEVSRDAGLTYKTLANSSDLDYLRIRGLELDQEGLRWLIKDRWTSSIVDICSIHKGITEFLKGEPIESSDFILLCLRKG